MRVLFLLLLLAAGSQVLAQETLAEAKFHEGSQYYINGNRDKAMSSVKTGLMSDPGNQKLTELKKLLEEDKKNEEQKKKEQEQKDKKEKQKQDQQKKEQEKKDKEEKEKQDQKDKEEKQKQDQEKKDEQKKDEKEKEEKQKEEKQDEKSKEKKDIPPDVADKLKDMKMSEEKAKMILEAMKNQEAQYLQQNKRKATKPKDKGKPDW